MPNPRARLCAQRTTANTTQEYPTTLLSSIESHRKNLVRQTLCMRLLYKVLLPQFGEHPVIQMCPQGAVECIGPPKANLLGCLASTCFARSMAVPPGRKNPAALPADDWQVASDTRSVQGFCTVTFARSSMNVAMAAWSRSPRPSFIKAINACCARLVNGSATFMSSAARRAFLRSFW